LASSAIAEFFADIALCPLEATRIRLVSQPTFATGLLSGFLRLWREEGVARGFYSGFGPSKLKFEHASSSLLLSHTFYSFIQASPVYHGQICCFRTGLRNDL
jgi:hypothetical protein